MAKEMKLFNVSRVFLLITHLPQTPQMSRQELRCSYFCLFSCASW